MGQSCLQCAFAFVMSMTSWMDLCCVAQAVALRPCRCLSATCCHWMGQKCFQRAFVFFNFYHVVDGFLLHCSDSGIASVPSIVSNMLTLDRSKLFSVRMLLTLL